MAKVDTRAVEAVDLGAVVAPRTELPGLDRVGVKIARGLTSVFAAAGGAVPIEFIDIRTMVFAEWQAGLPEAVAVGRYRDRAIKGGLLLSVPTAMLASAVDTFYGGDGAVDATRTALGAAEQRLFDRLARGSGEALTAAWADILPLAPALVGAAYTREDVALGKPGDMIAVQRFACGLGDVDIVYPLVALRGIPGLQGAAVEEATEEVDPAWRTRLSDAVMQARLPVRTVIARPSVALSRLMALAPGDFIPVTLPARVPLTVAGRLLAHGTIGEANGRAAIMIDKIEPGAFHD